LTIEKELRDFNLNGKEQLVRGKKNVFAMEINKKLKKFISPRTSTFVDVDLSKMGMLVTTPDWQSPGDFDTPLTNAQVIALATPFIVTHEVKHRCQSSIRKLIKSLFNQFGMSFKEGLVALTNKKMNSELTCIQGLLVEAFDTALQLRDFMEADVHLNEEKSNKEL
jgi:hypothetical protein